MPALRSNGTASKAATLARVRENQRRCRARRRERLAELEQKLKGCEVENSSSKDDINDRMKRLAQENDRLRALLEAAGLPRVWMEAFLKLGTDSGAQGGQLLSQQDTIAVFTGSERASADILPAADCANEQATSANNIQPDTTISTGVGPDFNSSIWTDMLFDFDLTPIDNDFDDASFNALASSISMENQITQECSTGSCCVESSDRQNDGKSDRNTTSCSVAFELVQRYNSKGLDMVEIWVRLWSGFHPGKRGMEDCTVNNKVLFGVLDHISG